MKTCSVNLYFPHSLSFRWTNRRSDPMSKKKEGRGE